jgi:hypothetical protein
MNLLLSMNCWNYKCPSMWDYGCRLYCLGYYEERACRTKTLN